MNTTKFLILSLIVLAAASTIQSKSQAERMLSVKASGPKASAAKKVTLPPPTPAMIAKADKAKKATPKTPKAKLAKAKADAKKAVVTAKKQVSKAKSDAKKATSDLTASNKKVVKLTAEIAKAKASKSKDKDLTIRKATAKLSAAKSKASASAKKIKQATGQADTAAVRVKKATVNANKKKPTSFGEKAPTKAQKAQATSPAKKMPKYIVYRGKRFRVKDDILKMKPGMRVMACKVKNCQGLSRTEINRRKKLNPAWQLRDCGQKCYVDFGHPLAYLGKKLKIRVMKRGEMLRKSTIVKKPKTVSK